VCAFVPGAVLAGASGLLFGAALGTLVAVVSATLGATFAFLLARAGAARPYRALATARVKGWTTRIERRGFLAMLYARPAPGAPFALVSYAASSTRSPAAITATNTNALAAPCSVAFEEPAGDCHHVKLEGHALVIAGTRHPDKPGDHGRREQQAHHQPASARAGLMGARQHRHRDQHQTCEADRGGDTAVETG
jgi:hypothetical protein